jgi:uncharacterized protein YcgI (DUF1989 family)
MDTPDYIICLECDTPVYTFEWDGVRVKDAICTACGNEKASLFATEEVYGEMMAMDNRYYGSTDD